jgi:AcrR family transcriptional regulator
MSDTEFDTALVTAAFRLAGEQGWRTLNVANAARAAGLPLAEARARFPSRTAILLRFGRLADQAALLDAAEDGPVRDRLFDLLMRRFDVLQTHRAGVQALLRSLPTDPPTALMLAFATRRSMRWMLQGAGITATGPRGAVQEQGLMAVWLWGVRAWERDESEDLSGTMAAIDSALQRADRLASWLHGRRAPPPPPPVSSGAGELDPSTPPPTDGLPPEGRLPPDGLPPDGLPPEGLPPEGLPPEGLPPDDDSPFDEPKA